MQQVVIIGGGYAGVMAALRLSGKAAKNTVQITLVNGEDHFVERVRLHQLTASQPLKKHPYSKLFKRHPIQFVQGWVTQLAPEAKTITLHDGRTLAYDTLIYALGSSIETHSVPGIKEHAFTVGNPQLAQQLQGLKAGRVVVAGGGLTGIETSTEIAEMYPHLEVVMLTRGQFGTAYSANGEAHLRQAFKRFHIQIHEHSDIAAVQSHQVVLTNGQTIPFEVGIWAGGFQVSPLAKHAGIKVNAGGQIIVDQHLRSVSHPDIYAVGDAASLADVLNIHIRMGCATALPMGAYVGGHIAGTETKPYSFAYVIRCISLGRTDGLIQFVHHDDSPKDRVITGWAGARVKEWVCRFAVGSLYAERLLPGIYPRPQHQASVKYMELQRA